MSKDVPILPQSSVSKLSSIGYDTGVPRYVRLALFPFHDDVLTFRPVADSLETHRRAQPVVLDTAKPRAA